MTIDTAVVPFALGSFRATVEDGVVRAARFEAARLPARRDQWGVHDVVRAYFDGDVDALDSIPVEVTVGTEFQRAVWHQLRRIPAGSTISYGELARRVGNPNASRAVGMANASNPVTLIVPCHRVVRTGGAIGGYAYGVDSKRWLLNHEDRTRLLHGTSLHRDGRHDRGADSIKDLVEAVAGDREPMIAQAYNRA